LYSNLLYPAHFINGPYSLSSGKAIWRNGYFPFWDVVWASPAAFGPSFQERAERFLDFSGKSRAFFSKQGEATAL
jgi:hypothetical protein